MYGARFRNNTIDGGSNTLLFRRVGLDGNETSWKALLECSKLFTWLEEVYRVDFCSFIVKTAFCNTKTDTSIRTCDFTWSV